MPCAQGNSTPDHFACCCFSLLACKCLDDPGSIEPGKHIGFFTSRVAVQSIIMNYD